MDLIAGKSATELYIEFKDTGRPEAFTEIVRRYSAMVYNTCLNITKNRHDAEDAAQATFLSLATQGRGLKDIKAVGPWLQKVAFRVSLDICRRRKRQGKHERAAMDNRWLADMPLDPHERADNAEVRPIVLTALNELPTRYRLPLVLHYFGGMKREEIARELNCNSSTLGVRLHRAHKLLRERVKGRGLMLEGSLLGLALTDAIHGQVLDGLVTSMTSAVTHLTNTGSTAAVAPHIASLADSVLHNLTIARYRTLAVVIVVGCTAAASTAHAIHKKLQELQLEMQSIPQLRDNLLPGIGLPIKLSDASSSFNPTGATSNTSAKSSLTPPQSPNASALASSTRPPSSDAANPSPADSDLADPSATINTAGNSPTASYSATAGSTVPLFEQRGDSSGPAAKAPSVSSQSPLASLPSMQAGQFSLPIPYQRPSQPLTAPSSLFNSQPGSSIDQIAKRPSSDNTPVTPNPTNHAVVVAQPASHSVWDKVQTTAQTYEVAVTMADGSSQTFAVQTDKGLNNAATEIYKTTISTIPMVGSQMAYAFTFDMSGQQFANGKTLDLSRYASLDNSIDNPTTNGYNGWFAANKGKLTLAPLTIPKGTSTVNWGEAQNDANIDLVNSVRLTFHDNPADTLARITLLATDTTGLPKALPGVASGQNIFYGLWHLTTDQPIGDGVDLTIRYDDELVSLNHRDEAYMKLWYYSDAAKNWLRVLDDSLALDTTNNLISGHIPSAGYFAVSTPEPTSLIAVISAGCILLMRRRRRLEQFSNVNHD